MSKQDKQPQKGRPLTEEEMAKLNLKKLPDGTVEGSIKMGFDNLKDIILFYLSLWRGSEELPDEKRKKIGETYNYLRDHLIDLKFNPKTKEITYTVKKTADRDQVNKHLLEDYIQGAIGIIFNEPEPKKTTLHKQPRGYLKTTAKLVGKSTGEPTLFSMPEIKKESGENTLREVISKNTAILGNYLLQLYQERGKEELVIDNLSELAEMMENTNYEIKIYLLYLGGYTYPIVDKKENGKGMSLTIEQLFKVTFNYGQKVAEKYPDGLYNSVGNNLTQFIKDEPLDSVTIAPSPLFLKALEGKGLGNVLVVSDKFIKLALSLETDIAYKILTYSASNKPTHKIGEDNLVKHLGLEKQIKSQGRPRVRNLILRGLQELKKRDHINTYSFNEEEGMYSYTYSANYIKYTQSKKELKLAQAKDPKNTL